jgi:hypothetical protein
MAMTAILDIDVLRTHAVSVITPAGFGDAPEPAWYRAPRPVLTMRWRVRPDGHLACHWETDISAAFGLPPD